MRKRTPIAVAVVLVAVGVAVTGEDEQATPTPAPSTSSTAPATPAPSPSATPSPAPVPTPAPTEGNSDGHIEALVERVVDGDTLRVNTDGTSTTVRIIGIDTPETVHPRKDVECYGPEASAEAQRLLTGTTVRLLPDHTQGTEDRYGRALAYVELADGLDYGAHMIEAGYAREATYDGTYLRQDAYRAAEDLAQAAGAGQWSAC